MRIKHDVVASDVCRQRRRTHRSRSAKTQPPIVRADADQITVAEAVHLHPADEEHMLVPVLHPVEAMPRIAVGFRPTHHAAVPAESRHRQVVQMGHVHARAEKDQFHVRTVHHVRQTYSGLHHRHRHPDAQHLAVAQVARDKHSHQFLRRIVL